MKNRTILNAAGVPVVPNGGKGKVKLLPLKIAEDDIQEEMGKVARFAFIQGSQTMHEMMVMSLNTAKGQGHAEMGIDEFLALLETAQKVVEENASKPLPEPPKEEKK